MEQFQTHILTRIWVWRSQSKIPSKWNTNHHNGDQTNYCGNELHLLQWHD